MMTMISERNVTDMRAFLKTTFLFCAVLLAETVEGLMVINHLWELSHWHIKSHAYCQCVAFDDADIFNW